MTKKTQILIETREQADMALQRIGQLTRAIESAEIDAENDIDRIRKELVRETAMQREALRENEKALEAWAKRDAKSWAGKTLDLVWGSISFRTPPPAIKLCLAVETIVERLRARKMLTCIRVKEEVDKEALENYPEAKRVKKVPITNLRRLLQSPAVRDKLGITVDDSGWAFSKYPVDEMFKWLRRIIHDLAGGKKVKSIYTKKDMLKYLDGFADHEIPDPKKALSEPIPVEPLEKAQSSGTVKRSLRKKPKRWSLKDAKIHPKHPRLQAIVEELEKVSYAAANIHTVMLRVFLDLSVDDFLSRHKIAVPPDKGKDTTLRARVLATVNHCETNGILNKHEASAVRRIAGSTKLYSAQTLSDFVHNPDLNPSPSDAETLWKNLGVFLARIHEN